MRDRTKSGVRRGIHICSGNMRGRPLSGDLSCAPWALILERLDGVIDVAHLAVHYFHRYLEREGGRYRTVAQAPARAAIERQEIPAWEAHWLPGFLARDFRRER